MARDQAFRVKTPEGLVTVYDPLPHQQLFHQSTARYTLLEGGRGSGKAVSLDTLVVTPTGYVPMADVRVGDQVLTPEGQPTTVMWKSETHLDATGTYRVFFEDGTTVVCGGAHEWVTSTADDRRRAARQNPEARARRQATRTDAKRTRSPRPHKRNLTSTPIVAQRRTTVEIASSLVVMRGKPHNNHAVRVSDPWVLPEQPLPIPPYTFGVWLGDGDTIGGAVTTPDREVIAGVEADGYAVHRVPSGPLRWRVEGLTTQLAAMGLAYDQVKAVPEVYLWGSEAQRLALLQGLMDTDGYCEQSGSVEFCNTNKEIAEAVRHLAVSLGIKACLYEGRATLYGKDCGPKYRVMWTSDVPVFRLPRKAARLKPAATLRGTQHRRFVVGVERIDDVPVQCIEVASEGHEYLVTRAGVPTHNSLAMRMEAIMMGLAIPGFKALIIRRSAPELKSSHLMELPREIARMGLSPDAFHSTDMKLRLPQHSLVQFAHLEDEKALTKMLSTQYDAIFGDELATFLHTQFTWALTSLRSTIPGFIPYFKGGTNPVGPGAGWVRDLWITRAAAEDPKRYPGYRAEDYLAIHADMDENPYVNPEVYAQVFEGIASDAVRNALRHGIWAIEGQAFSEFAPEKDGRPWHVIPQLPRYKGVPISHVPHYEVVRAIDWGYQRPGVCLWIVLLPDNGAIVFKEWYFQGMTPEQVCEVIHAESEGLTVRYTVADTAMWQEHVGPSIAERFENSGVPMVEADKHRINGWVQVHTWLRTEVDQGDGPRPQLQFLKTPEGLGCPKLIRSMPEMVIDEKNPEDIQTRGVEDDGPDALRYFCMSRAAPSREPRRPQSAARREIEAHMAKKRRSMRRLGAESTHR